MYLKVKSNTLDQEYMLTESYNKPYIRISDSVLPITIGGGAIQLNIDNNTYRPMTYGPMSTSYYTTSSDSSGLYDTTALTEISTTDTSYETSMNATRYSAGLNRFYSQTQKSNNALLTQFESTSLYILSSFSTLQTVTKTVGNPSVTEIDFRFTPVAGGVSSSTQYYCTITIANSNSSTTTYTNSGTYTPYAGGPIRFTTYNYSINTYTGDMSSLNYSNFDLYREIYVESTSSTYSSKDHVWLSAVGDIITTGTSYLTAETTTAYSGIYSSIQSGSSSWYTSAEVSDGMYDTTALTRESTSGTSYLTSTQKGSTGYDIISYIVNSRRDIYRTEERIYTGTMLNYFTITNVSSHAVGIRIYNSVYGSNAPYLTTYGTEYRTTNGSSTSGSRTFSTNDYNMSYYWTFIRNDAQTNILTLWLSSVNTKQIGTDGPVSTSLTYLAAYSSSVTLNITASQYGDTTITTGTSYLTCESTSGYSGVSSTSSIAYGWS